MKRLLPPESLQLLALVRASLWQQPVDEALFTADTVDWRRIGRLALQQTVGPSVFEAAVSLPAPLLPPGEWCRQAFAFIRRNAHTHHLLDSCAAEAVARLREEGIHAVLLKGQAYARVYPSPDMRQCGDIDLYVGEAAYHNAYSAVRKLGWESEENFNPEAKHYGCLLRGVRVELHGMAAKLYPASVDRWFREWSRSQLSLSCRTVAIAGQDISVPTPIFDIVFVFLHLYHHFLNGGVGLRHLCDWTMLLHAHVGAIDLVELEHTLRKLRLLEAWKTFTPVAVLHLGLPERECPFYSSAYIGRAERVVATVMEEGNFGKGRQNLSVRPDGYLAGKLYALRQLSINNMRRLWIDPVAVSGYYGRRLLIGGSHVLKDLTGGKWR